MNCAYVFNNLKSVVRLKLYLFFVFFLHPTIHPSNTDEINPIYVSNGVLYHTYVGLYRRVHTLIYRHNPPNVRLPLDGTRSVTHAHPSSVWNAVWGCVFIRHHYPRDRAEWLSICAQYGHRYGRSVILLRLSWINKTLKKYSVHPNYQSINQSLLLRITEIHI